MWKIYIEILSLYGQDFNPHFLSLTFETILTKEGATIMAVFQSFQFQSSFSEFDLWNLWGMFFDTHLPSISILIFWVWPLKQADVFVNTSGAIISILIFWVWPLKRSTQSKKSRCSRISILIFWVWPLKPVIGVGKLWISRNFNPHFLSLTFETSKSM